MDAMKGLAMVGGIVAGGAILAAAPVLTVSAPFWGLMGTTYSVNGVALAGASAAISAGAGVGRIAGQTGGALVIQGLDDASTRLVSRLKTRKKEDKA